MTGRPNVIDNSLIRCDASFRAEIQTWPEDKVKRYRSLLRVVETHAKYVEFIYLDKVLGTLFSRLAELLNIVEERVQQFIKSTPIPAPRGVDSPEWVNELCTCGHIRGCHEHMCGGAMLEDWGRGKCRFYDLCSCEKFVLLDDQNKLAKK